MHILLHTVPLDNPLNFMLCILNSFIGRKEGTVNSSSSYYILSRGQDGAFEALPVESWCVKHVYLSLFKALLH